MKKMVSKMKNHVNIKSKKGAVLPLVTVFMVCVAFGIIALVVDAGMLYAEKKAMVTAADAAALAGAQVLSGGNDAATAENTAREYGLKNGAAKIDAVVVGPNMEYNRKVIKVVSEIEKDNLFAKLIGFNSSTVKSKAVATWGYVKEYNVNGNMIPLFTFDIEFQNTSKSGIQYGLHEQLPNSPPNYGYVNVSNPVNQVLEGKKTVETIQSPLYSKTGAVESIAGSIQSRLEEARKLDLSQRELFMTGLIPVIDTKAFLEANFGIKDMEITDISQLNDLTIGEKKWWDVTHLELPFDYFAVYVIEDVVIKNQPYGLGASLYTSGYQEFCNITNHKAGAGINYSEKDNNRIFIPSEGPQASMIIGRYTGEITDRVKITDGDQQDPDPNADGEATYFKLIE